MKKTIVRYGGYAGLLVIALYGLNLLLFSEDDYAYAEIAGFTAILLSLSFLYFGIRYYRDRQNSGVLTFWQGLKTGLLITLIPSVCFGLADVFYITVIDPHFYDKYLAIGLQRLKAEVPPGEYPAKAAAFSAQAAQYRKPVIDFLLMFATVAALGVIITVISTFILKRSVVKAKPAYASAA